MNIKKNDILYVTVMLRYGDPEAHHYITGVFPTKEKARLSGETEKSWRGGKYEYEIQEIPFNMSIPDEKLKHHYGCA